MNPSTILAFALKTETSQLHLMSPSASSRSGFRRWRRRWPNLDKLKIPRCGLHAFRHGRVSFLIENNVPVSVIKEWIGHGSNRMIEHYTHSRPEFHQKVLATLPPIVDPLSHLSTQSRNVRFSAK